MGIRYTAVLTEAAQLEEVLRALRAIGVTVWEISGRVLFVEALMGQVALMDKWQVFKWLQVSARPRYDYGGSPSRR
jgi:hypothetical protein